jgi:hypothetical protein
MHEMKEWRILKIFTQESPKSELRLQRYDEKSFGELFVIFVKLLGVYLELFSKIRGSSWNFVDCELILNKNRGLFAKWGGFLDSDLFSNGKRRGLGP